MLRPILYVVLFVLSVGDNNCNAQTEVTTTVPRTTAVPSQCSLTSCIAFNVGSTNASVSAKITFDEVTVNDGEAFNVAEQRFIVPSQGFYWLHLSIGIPSGSYAETRLLGSDRIPGITRRHNTFNTGVDTIGRDQIVALNATDSCSALFVSTDYNVWSDNYTQTTFAGFLINGIMQPVVVFSVGKSTPTTTTGTIAYDLVNIDTNLGWNTSSSYYVVPVTGTYVISLSSGAAASVYHTMCLRTNNALVTCIFMADTRHTSDDTLTKTAVVDLDAGANLTTTLDIGTLFSNYNYQTALQGFLYTPYRVPPVTWSVFRQLSGVVTGPVENIDFDFILNNKGSVWDPIKHQVDIPLTGTYYVHLSAGIANGLACKMELMLNGATYVNYHRQSTAHSGIDTRSRAVIVRLNQGDILHVRLPAGYSLYSDTYRIAGFTGFRIYA